MHARFNSPLDNNSCKSAWQDSMEAVRNTQGAGRRAKDRAEAEGAEMEMHACTCTFMA